MPPVLDASNAASEPIKNEGSDRSRRYSCPLCPYATMTAKTIREHIQMGHTKLKEFKCPNCSWSTAYEQHLIRHLKLHGDAQSPIAVVAPVSADREREMPRPQRRPLSSIGHVSICNDRAVAVVPARSASFHHAMPRRLSSAVAGAPVTADKGRSRRNQFEAEKKEEKDRKEAEPVAREVKQEESEEQKSEESLADRVKKRKSGKEEKEEEEEGKEVKKADKETAVRVEQKGVETRSPAPRARRSFTREPQKSAAINAKFAITNRKVPLRAEKDEGREEEMGQVERMDGKRRARKSVEEKREEVVDEKPPRISDAPEEKEVVEKEEEEPVERKEVKRPGRKSAEKKKKVLKASVKEEEKRPIRHARLSAEKSAKEEREGRGEDSSIRSSAARKRSRNSSASSAEEKAGETGRKKRGRPSFAEVEERKRKEEEAEQRRSTATVEVKREAMEQIGEGEGSGMKEEERDDEMLDVSALDAAIAEAEANAARERVRPAMPTMERKRKGREEEGPSTRKRVHFAPLPEKHHARHMPAKRRKRGEGEREGDAMRSSRAARDLSSFFSSFDTPASARSISSPDRSGRRATIIEAMKARASQLEQQDDEMAEEAAAEIKLPFSVIPFESPQRPQPIDEFESSDDENTVAVPSAPVKPVRKTPVKARKPTGATVSPRTTVSPVEAGKKKAAKSAPAKKARDAAASARAAATAARKREQARAARIRRLKRDVARRLAKSADRRNVAARAVVEEEDRYWRTSTEVTPLEQSEWSGEQRLFSWPEIHNARRRLAIDVEPVRRAEGGERRVETLHAISTSSYLARAVELKQRCEIDGIVKIVKSFDRVRSPPLDWSYEEKETEDALHPTVPSEFVPGGRLRCL